MSFNLQPDDQIIKKGQQIGLLIFSSDSEYTLLPKPGTTLTIDVKETKINIPIVGGENAFKSATNKLNN
jgi:X-Pro dipeptidyl-peptidase